MRFTKECWDMLKDDIVDFFNELHTKAALPKVFSAFFINLIPKNDNPQGLGEYRPICLIGCVHKILAKALASRLKRVLPNVILNCQSAFLDGRYILDGVVVVSQLVDLAKRNNEECLLFKVDFDKAFDCISWNVLFYMMERFGFNPGWIKWMNACICSSSLSLLVNDSPTKDF